MSNLPQTPEEAETRFYARYGPQGVGTWSGVQRLLGNNRPAPKTVEDWIKLAEDVREKLSTPPTTLREASSALTAPFAIEHVEVKPGATNGDKSQALALAYVDLRAYQDRLDAVVGPEGWAVEYRQLGKSLICRLTILGVSKEDVGEPSADGSNPATEALAQAFKRTCSAFGLGRYLYSLPKEWYAFDAERKRFRDPRSIPVDLYRKAGLL
jgi:hypothetical protein